MTTKTTPTASQLIQKYRREPSPGPPVGGYDKYWLREKRAKHTTRVRIALDILNGTIDPARYDGDVEELLAEKYFTREELDELFAAGQVVYDEKIAHNRDRLAGRELAAMIRSIDTEWTAEAEAERQRKLEAEARKRLGWPDKGFPE